MVFMSDAVLSEFHAEDECFPFLLSVLHVASQHGFTEMTELLIHKGAVVNATDYQGLTPLHVACQRGHQAVVVSVEIFNSLAPGGSDYSLKLVNFKVISVINILKYFLWSCYQVNATTPHWSSVNIGSGNGLVPSGNKPLLEPMLTQIPVTRPQLVNVGIPYALFLSLELTHWGWDKIEAILQTTFSNAISWMKMFEFRLKYHGRLFLNVQLTIFQHWFR